jgi:hypothetical protein
MRRLATLSRTRLIAASQLETAPPTPYRLDMNTSSASPPVDPEVARVDQLAHDVLRENYRSFSVERLELIEAERVSINVQLRRQPENDVVVIAGEGVGLIDAFFDGAMQAWAQEFPSLKTISVSDFRVGAGFDQARGRRSDALAVATLRVRNSHDVDFTFEQHTPSVTRSSVRVAMDALTFFINAERAWIQLTLAVQDATERRRSDLVARYRQQMSLLVHATSYSEVSEKLRH